MSTGAWVTNTPHLVSHAQPQEASFHQYPTVTGEGAQVGAENTIIGAFPQLQPSAH